MRRTTIAALTTGATMGMAALLAACGSSGEGGREVNITQADSGCTPTTIQATPGEKLKLVVKNDSGKDYEVEGIDGTKLEEVVVPSGRTRTPGYTVPDTAGTYKIKCYVPAGVSTIIEVRAGGGAAGGETPVQPASPSGEAPAGAAPFAVTLEDHRIEPASDSVAAGQITFTATNASDEHVHELYVLRVKDDGSKETVGEIEDIDPGTDGEMTLDLAPGNYELACLIVPGEAGSTVDHYQEGMHAPLRVG
jgi:uncharacterized cupredoxin-like copper-binding protein